MAKLVDILARELRAWPCASWVAVGQSNSGSLHEIHPPVSRRTAEHYSMADDWANAEVTRAQWQAAVDALKATENTLPEWTGEGLPPIGTVCEFATYHGGDPVWKECKIIAHDDGFAVIAYKGNYSGQSNNHLRPIRAPEQIEADDRANAIQYMRDLWCEAESSASDGFAALYDAGYIKQVKS